MEELTKEDDILIKSLIDLNGLSIAELYDSLDDDEYNKELLKLYIELEKALYKEFKLTYKKYFEILNYLKKNHIKNIESGIIDPEVDAKSLNFSLRRFIDRVTYATRGMNNHLNGHVQNMVDFMTQILFSELMLEAESRPDMKEALKFYAYSRLNKSPYAESEVIKNDFKPFNYYENRLLFFYKVLKFKSKTNPKIKLNSFKELNNDVLKKVVEPELKFAFKLLCKDITNEIFSLDRVQTVATLTSIKSLIAIYPEEIRIRMYEKYYTELMDISDNDREVMNAIKELFYEIESTTVNKIANIGSVNLSRRKD